MIIVVVVIRKRNRNREDGLIKDGADDAWDEKRRYKYDIKRAADDFTIKHLKENNIDEEFAEGAIMNPMFSPEGELHDNPMYLVS